MIGPFVLIVGAAIAGAISAGGAGAFGGALAGLGLVGGVLAGAALWASRMRNYLDPAEAWELAPRPPGFRRSVDAVYRRYLPSIPEGGADPS